jgi:hypothetical protein
MNSKLYTIVLGVALTACSTGKKALEKGNFDEAVYTAVERLQKSPTNSTSQQVLKEAYPLALNYHQGRVNNWEKSTEPFHWERVISEYDAMNQLGSAIDNCPPCIRVVGDGKKFVEPLQAARNLAASDRYDSGNFHLGNAKEIVKRPNWHSLTLNELHKLFRDTRTFPTKWIMLIHMPL